MRRLLVGIRRSFTSSRADVQIASQSLNSQIKAQLQVLGIEACLDLADVPMDENQRDEFVSTAEMVASSNDDNEYEGNFFLESLYRIASGEISAELPNTSTRRSAESSDPAYNAVQGGGYNNGSYFTHAGMSILRYGFYMLLQSRHSSTADHVGMVSDALKVRTRSDVVWDNLPKN